MFPGPARTLVALGFGLIAAGSALFAEQILRTLVGNVRWQETYEFVVSPLSLVIVVAGWWLVGGVGIVTSSDALRAARAAALFAVVQALQSSISFVQIASFGFGSAGTVQQISQWLGGVGPALAGFGFALVAISLRRTVLDLPGVVGDVVPDLAQAEPEGPAPVG